MSIDDGSEHSEGHPRQQVTLATTIDAIHQGKALSLPTIGADEHLARLRLGDPETAMFFVAKTRDFLHRAAAMATDELIADSVRIDELESAYATVLGLNQPEAEQDSAIIRLKIMRLGALVFAGAAHPVDPKKENRNVNQHLDRLKEVKLSEAEREIVTALAAGTELGYGQHATEAENKIGRLVTHIQQYAVQRSEVPEQEGDDFIEALLVTDL